jgi:hypothetical protein
MNFIHCIVFKEHSLFPSKLDSSLCGMYREWVIMPFTWWVHENSYRNAITSKKNVFNLILVAVGAVAV